MDTDTKRGAGISSLETLISSLETFYVDRPQSYPYFIPTTGVGGRAAFQ